MTVAIGSRVVRSRVYGRDLARLAVDFGSGLYREEADVTQARLRALRDVRAGAIADAAGVDLFITMRPILVSPPFRIQRESAALTPEQAIPVIGLYLRTQGTYLVDVRPGAAYANYFDRGLFYWTAARGLLPAGRRWMDSCIQQSKESGDDTLGVLALSLHQRLASALKARDQLLLSLVVPQDSNSADQALEALDTLLLYLMSTCDIAARATHLILGQPRERIRHAAWQRKDWHQHLKRKAPQLAAHVEPGSAGWAVLTVLRSLRNTIHGEALLPLAVTRVGSGDKEILVTVPRDAQDGLMEAFDVLGDKHGWGIRLLVEGRLHADSYNLVERLLPAVADLLNSLLADSPLDSIGHARNTAAVNLNQGDEVAPDVLANIMGQLGL